MFGVAGIKNRLSEKTEKRFAFHFGICPSMAGNFGYSYIASAYSNQKLIHIFCSAQLVPLAYFISKKIGVDFQNKDNPLTKLGLIFTSNQIFYLSIVMWVYTAIPDAILMVYAIVFGAHLFPYGWLYQSKTYYILSIIIPIGVLILGLLYNAAIIAIFMLIVEIVFCCCLIIENQHEEN